MTSDVAVKSVLGAQNNLPFKQGCIYKNHIVSEFEETGKWLLKLLSWFTASFWS